MKIKEVEQKFIKLSNSSPLKFSDIDKVKAKTAHEFISGEEFFEHNRIHPTIHVGGMRHTRCGRRRSIEDIFIITRYYFPKVTLEEIYIAISKSKSVNILTYTNVKKTVYHSVKDNQGYRYRAVFSEDEHGVNLVPFYKDMPRITIVHINSNKLIYRKGTKLTIRRKPREADDISIMHGWKTRKKDVIFSVRKQVKYVPSKGTMNFDAHFTNSLFNTE